MPWKKDSLRDRSRAIWLSSCRDSSNLSMKKELRPKDLTVRMLLTVSEMRHPMNF
jgi:hypothetical protein